jgi:hypothetical protein
VKLGPLVPVAVNKEFRAIAPAWVACLAMLVAADLMEPEWSLTSRIAFGLLGPAALGAFSMGHEYSGGTLSLLLSQPRRRERMLLVKLGVLASMLLTLSGVQLALGVRPPHEQTLVLALPLLCGLFIAPWFTMLCRNSLAGIVFTLATPAVVTVAGAIAAGVRAAADPAMAAGAANVKTAVLWWGMFAVSAVAAVSSWRLFIRLEAIDGRGQAFRLRSPGAGIPPTTTIRHSATRSPLWLLMKKELRLQQLSFAVGVLYAFGWLVIWSGRSAVPYLSTSLLFALTALNGLAAPVLAGSVASAEERQLRTIEWHALLPMSARMQWAIKVGVTVGVACMLGLALPMGLATVTGSQEIREGVRPFLTAGAGFTVILLSVMSLYVSSLCTSSLQALLWSVAVALGLMTFANSWFLEGIRLGTGSRFNPFWSLRWWDWAWDSGGRLFILLMLMSALAVLLYAGAVGLLLRYAHANHQSAERGSRRLGRQVLSLAMFLALVVLPLFGVSKMLHAEARAQQRAFMQRTFGFVTVAAVDSRNKPLTNYTVVVFPEGRSRLLFEVDPAGWPAGRVETHLRPGRYSVVAIEPFAREFELAARRDPELLARLKARSTPLTIAAGESTTLHLTLLQY